MHVAGLLQAKQKSNHWCEIKPVQEKNLKYFIFKSALLFFCLKLQPKQNLSLKGHWENLKIGGVTKQTKINFMNKRMFFLFFVFFFMLCLGENEIKGRKKYIFFCYTSYLKVFPVSFQEQVLFLF